MTRKDTSMKWDQIESKWTLMTRRIRADFGDADCSVAKRSSLGRPDAVKAAIADTQISGLKDPEFKTSAK